jgi:pyruvate formate lyase activating enzyme
VHDGPGCRTVFFLSGCPLRCRWCANPEGIACAPRLLHYASRCKCGLLRCAAACPRGAVSPGPVFNRALCDSCPGFECVAACFHGALKSAGREYSLAELAAIVRRDRDFWGADGGVTLSGGEPLFQPEFALALLRLCRESGVHCALETSAFAPAAVFAAAAAECDWLFVDLKHMDAEKHKAGAGQPNGIILENITALGRVRWPGRLVARLPLVPGYNDDEANLSATAAFLLDNGLKEINILPFHPLGESKYRQLGLNWEFAAAPPSDAALPAAARLFTAKGINCYLGPDTPF